MSDIRIGISGWRYAPWRKHFYPAGLAQRCELEYASRAVNSIEINGSFYALQTPERYANWHNETPADFVFSVKAPRFITHIKRLRDIETPLANFFASGIFQLKKKLGPILWQFPPNFKFNSELFEAFLKSLPHTGSAAKKLAQACDEKWQQNGYLKIPARYHLRHAVEIRNQSFVNEDFIKLLRKYKVALVVADTAGKWPYAEDVTSDFIYMRLHGDEELYSSGYGEVALRRWQQRITAWSQGHEPPDPVLISGKAPQDSRKRAITAERDIYCYFDNDVKVHAPYDARKLLEKLNLTDTLTVKPGQMIGAEV